MSNHRNVVRYVLVDVLRLYPVTEGVRVREQKSGSVPVFWFDVPVVEVIHQGLGKVQDGLSEVDGFVQGNLGLSHAYGNQLRALEDERPLVVRSCDEPFQFLGLLVVHYPDLRPLPHVLHGLTEHGVVH